MLKQQLVFLLLLKSHLAVAKAPPADQDEPLYSSVHDKCYYQHPPNAKAAFCVPAPARPYFAVAKAPPVDQAPALVLPEL